ncbi:phage holin family protein [Catellatospora citrea]|uniref:DUF4190 domain-containing protein n=1 Tax=Catellatospora citrea TaxID=53366 RepID=A0A8J3P4M6_9ACTN|nr:phage holin family protein [Catellatospora citrea]RKE08323.1 hypothetical protein C8E86_3167 [Catellatospora citrea]GIG01361.1 hypothetical protein Cci01nite_64540 [Catellatospora citrea]
MTYQQPPVPQWPSVPSGQQPPAPQWPVTAPTGPQPPSASAAGQPPSASAAGQPPSASAAGQPVAGPQPVNYPPPVRVEVVPGTPYGLAVLGAPKTASGVAASALVVGAGSILVSLVVWCFGVAGAQQGWGGLVAGAFAALAILLGAAGVLLGWLGIRQIRLAAGNMTGRGVAVAGLVCGAVGLLLAAVGLLTAIVLSAR